MKDFIKKHYGSNVRMAQQLGITNQTVSNWLKSNPRGMLKYLPEIVKTSNTTESQVMWEVMFREKELSRD
jgi:predicted transcriptional regulator